MLLNWEIKQLYFNELLMNDKSIVELFEEGMCDRLWLVISQVEVVTVFTVAACGLQIDNNKK